MNRTRRAPSLQKGFQTPQKSVGGPQSMDSAQSAQKQQIAKLEPPPENPFKENVLEAADLVDENGKVKFKKIFASRKKASVRAREKRIRQNRHLRKTIYPKSALMSLHELKGVSVGESTFKSNPEGGGFIALVTVNNEQFEGRGKSKLLAKHNACEKALRDYIIAKMRENPRHPKGISGNNSVSNESMDTSGGNEDGNGDDNENDANDGGGGYVPMVNLASFALYKLFAEWEKEGFVIPEMHSFTASDNDVSTTGPKNMAPNRDELPENWESMQPAALLKFMRPGVNYEYRGSTGERPNMMQTLAVSIDEQEFVAQGRPKRFARRNVAALACNTVFNTNFLLDVKEEPVCVVDVKVENTEDTATPVEN